MFIIAQRKKSVVLLAMMIQMPAYGITELQAKIGTALAGTLTLAGAAVISDGENHLGLIGLAGAGVGALAYRYLMTCTPRAQLAHINLELNKVTDQGYGTCWLKEGTELRAFVEHEEFFKSLKPNPGEEKYEDLIRNIKRCSRGNAQYSLAVAYEQVTSLYPVIEKSLSLLQPIHGDAKADELLEQWEQTRNRCENYFKELETVDLWIKEHPSFAKENKSYQKWKKENEQLRINQQIADAEMLKANAKTVRALAEMKKADAQDKKADAAQSNALVRWLKFFWRIVFWSRK